MHHHIKPIGIIHTPYASKEACPIQGKASSDSRGHVELFPDFEEGLQTIETFTHLILLYLFDRAGEVVLSRPTFLDDAPHGVFASRHPCRPNGIGLSIVKLLACKGGVLDIAEVDMLDGTPLIDIKPYVPKFDYREGAGDGWLGERSFREKPENRE